MSDLRKALTATLERAIVSAGIVLVSTGVWAYQKNRPYREVFASRPTALASAMLGGMSVYYGLGYYRGRREREK